MNVIFEASGLYVLCTESSDGTDEIHKLPQARGVILGKLMPALSENLPLELLSSTDGLVSRLITSHWGRYVAFLHDFETSTCSILRDPTGGLPCFMYSYEGVHVSFSCMQDCVALGMFSFSINWRHIAEFMTYPTLYVRDTGLNEVSEVNRGECLTLGNTTQTVRRLLWNPVKFATSNPIEDVDEAVQAVRSVTQACVTAWARTYPRIVLKLSGGLDSSIVLACLSTLKDRRLEACVNYYDASAHGDERRYARTAARSARIALHECERMTSATPMPRILTIYRSARPAYYHFPLVYRNNDRDFARAHGAQAMFDGEGGDQIFSQLGLWDAATDYARAHPFGRQGLAIARDVARGYNIPCRRVLMAASRAMLDRSPPGPLGELRSLRTLVHPDVIERVSTNETSVHPWLNDMRNLPPGKFWHILGMTTAEDFYNPFDSADEIDRVHPLISQPLIELVLRMPVYVLSAGGIDRAVARRAFGAELPRQIATRRRKGDLTPFISHLLSRNLSFVRDVLVNGILVNHGLLDRTKIIDLFNNPRVHELAGGMELVSQHLSLEAWLQSWRGVALRG